MAGIIVLYGRHLLCMASLYGRHLVSLLYDRHLHVGCIAGIPLCRANIPLYASPWQPTSGLNPEKFGDRSPGSSGAHSTRG